MSINLEEDNPEHFSLLKNAMNMRYARFIRNTQLTEFVDYWTHFGLPKPSKTIVAKLINNSEKDY